MRAIFSFLLLLLSGLCLNAKGVNEITPVPSDTIMRTDSMGRQVLIKKELSSIISLTPGITEILFALGQQDKLTGITNYCDYPAETELVSSVGSMTQPDLEKIVSINPDIIIAGTHFTEETLGNLTNAGMPVFIIKEQESFEGTYEMIQTLGELTDSSDKASEIVSLMKKDVTDITEKVSRLNLRKSVYYVVGYGDSGEWTAGGDTFIHQMISMAGGDNIASDITGWAYSRENIIEEDPSVIVIPQAMKENFIKNPLYSDLTAVKNGHVSGIDENMIVRQGPRLGTGLRQLYKAIQETD